MKLFNPKKGQAIKEALRAGDEGVLVPGPLRPEKPAGPAVKTSDQGQAASGTIVPQKRLLLIEPISQSRRKLPPVVRLGGGRVQIGRHSYSYDNYLALATEYGDLDGVKDALSLGADPNQGVIWPLLQPDASDEAKAARMADTSYSRSPMEIARQKGFQDIVAFLESRGGI